MFETLVILSFRNLKLRNISFVGKISREKRNIPNVWCSWDLWYNLCFRWFFFKAQFYIAEQSNISKLGKVEKPVTSVDKSFPSPYCKLLQKWIKEDKRSIIFILGVAYFSYRPNWKKNWNSYKILFRKLSLF